MKNIQILTAFLLGLAFMACEPELADKRELGDLPNPSFTIVENGSPNDFLLTNTTTDGFLTQWDLGIAGTGTGNEIEANFPFKGDYDIIMTAFNAAGSASTTQTLTVTEDDPSACSGVVKLLTNCDSKTWKLAPEAGALHVGSSLTDTWWANSEADITARECHWNDEYIFSISGAFEYDNKGDFWADSDSDGNIYPPALGLTVGCHPSTAWPDDFKPWDSGIHAFSATDTKINVVGNGAWIGLYKVGTAAEVTEPQTSVSYSISEITETRMVLFADLGGTVWRFTLVSE